MRVEGSESPKLDSPASVGRQPDGAGEGEPPRRVTAPGNEMSLQWNTAEQQLTHRNTGQLTLAARQNAKARRPDGHRASVFSF